MSDPIILDKGNGRERLEFKVSDFKGKKYVDIRTFYLDEDEGTWNHTKKGITVRMDRIHFLLESFMELMGEVDWKGTPFDFIVFDQKKSEEVYHEYVSRSTEFVKPTVIVISDHRKAVTADAPGPQSNGAKKSNNSKNNNSKIKKIQR